MTCRDDVGTTGPDKSESKRYFLVPNCFLGGHWAITETAQFQNKMQCCRHYENVTRQKYLRGDVHMSALCSFGDGKIKRDISSENSVLAQCWPGTANTERH